MVIFFRNKRLSILLLICILFNLFIPINQIIAQTNNGLTNMYSKSYCVMDGNNGRVLDEKDSNTELSNASTTKILTCILILENCDINSYATASEAAAMQQEVKLGVKTGEKYKIKDLLYAMMLESYNDCAYVLAEAAAQNVEKFCAGLLHFRDERDIMIAWISWKEIVFLFICTQLYGIGVGRTRWYGVCRQGHGKD